MSDPFEPGETEDPSPATRRDPFGEGEAGARARRGRSILIAVGLVAFVLLVFFVTIVRLGANVADRF